MLLSVLRNILALCLKDRIGEKIDKEIPTSSLSAYRKGLGTTEHVFTKLVIERTVTSKDETVYLLLFDMSKAFNSINQSC